MPKRYIQPAYYKKVFAAWAAVYFDSNDAEFHLQLVLDPWGWQDGHKYAVGVEVLKQNESSRCSLSNPGGGHLKTIKAGIEELKRYMTCKHV